MTSDDVGGDDFTVSCASPPVTSVVPVLGEP